MRIACVTWSYDDHQGISRCVVELTARLVAEHEVHVYAAHASIEPRPGVQLHLAALRRRGPHSGDWDFFFRVGSALGRERFDLVHAHFPVVCPTDVYTCHGLARMALREWRRFPPEAKVDVPTRRMLPWYAQVPLYRHVLRRGRPQIAAVSSKARAEAAEESGRAIDEIELVPNAVDLARFCPDPTGRARAEARRELGLADGQFALLWVGNHLRHKGMRHALAVLERLPASAVLVAVGADRPERLSDLAPQIARLQAASRLRFVGVQRDIERCYAAADALLFPSLYESFGLVVLEAMAMGLPVVTARSVGFAEDAIRDGVNGLVVDRPWHVDALVQRVELLLADRGRARQIGEAGRQTAQAYGWDAHVRATERVYEKALARRGAARDRSLPRELLERGHV